MEMITIQEAQTQLCELVHSLKAGQEIVITENNQPVAKLVATSWKPLQERQLGKQPNSVFYMAPDFDAPLDDFKEYAR